MTIVQPPRRPLSPGEILAERELRPKRIATAALARAAGLTREHLSKILNGRARITAEVAVRLGRALGVAPLWLLELQAKADLAEIDERLPVDATRPLDGTAAEDVRAKLTAAEAGMRLLELRKGKSLDRILSPGETLKDLIAAGRA
jgi:addiction module HigA family antidote